MENNIPKYVDITETLLRGKFIALNAYITKEKGLQ